MSFIISCLLSRYETSEKTVRIILPKFRTRFVRSNLDIMTSGGETDPECIAGSLTRARTVSCRQGALRMIAAITQVEVIRKILRHLKRAADPPPLAPARARQATSDGVA